MFPCNMSIINGHHTLTNEERLVDSFVYPPYAPSWKSFLRVDMLTLFMLQQANGNERANNQGQPSYMAPPIVNELISTRMSFETNTTSCIAMSFRPFPEIEKLRMAVNVSRMTKAKFMQMVRKMQLNVAYSQTNMELVARLFRIFKVFQRTRQSFKGFIWTESQTEGIELVESEVWRELLEPLGVTFEPQKIKEHIFVGNVLLKLVKSELPQKDYTQVLDPELSFALFLQKQKPPKPYDLNNVERILREEVCDRLTVERPPAFSIPPYAAHTFCECTVKGIMLAIQKALDPSITLLGTTTQPYDLAWLYYCGILSLN